MEIIYTTIAVAFYFIGGIGFAKVAAAATERKNIDFIVVISWPIAAIVASVAFKIND